MSIIHVDDFGSYGGNSTRSLMFQGVYAGIGDIQYQLLPDPSGTGKNVLWTGFGSTNLNGAGIRWILPSAQQTVGFAVRIWQEQIQDNNAVGLVVCRFQDPTGGYVGRVYFNSLGAIVAEINGGAIYTAPTTSVTAAGFYHIEIKWVASTSGGGSITVYVEGVQVLSEVNLTMPSATIGQLTFADYYNNYSTRQWGWYWKDMVIWDSAGTINNDVLGTVLVADLDLTGDVALNWTPSTGMYGYTILNSDPPNDSQYISAGYSPIPSPYVATMSEVPVDSTTVRALVTRVRAAKVDGGDGFLQVGLQSDSNGDGTWVTGLGANRPITVAQTYWTDVFEVDPKTSAPWTPSGANQARLQINRTV